MKQVTCIGIAAAVAGLLSATVLAEEPVGQGGLLKRAANVDNPIPETYEPLNSTYVGEGERLNQTIEQSWQLKQEARELEVSESAPAAETPERKTLESRIQEPGPGPAPASEPPIRDTGKSLEIKGD